MNLSYLMGYGVECIAPLKERRKGDTCSKYAPMGTSETTLAGGFTNFLLQVASEIAAGECKFGCGYQEAGSTVAERMEEGGDSFTITSYSPTTGVMLGVTYKIKTKKTQQYIVGKTNRNGFSVWLGLLPILIEDEEFAENFEILVKQAGSSYGDIEHTLKVVSVLNDNVYRRLKDNDCVAYIPLKILEDKKEENNTLGPISRSALATGVYNVSNIVYGEFRMLEGEANSSKSPSVKNKGELAIEDYIGKYKFSNRVLTETEEKMFQNSRLDDNYVIGENDTLVANIIKETTDLPIAFRNFTFRGPAGTGKSALAKSIANAVGLPLTTYTCSSNTEIYDFIGQVMPETSGKDTTPDSALLKKCQELGGVNYENIAKVMQYPSMEDIAMDYELAMEAMGLKDVPTFETQEDGFVFTIKKWEETISSKMSDALASESKETKFVYTETDFIRAIKNGWVVEIQEPNVIMSEGVLVGLNGLLAEGNITLPTGEVIKRHPDTIIIFTTNVNYSGCRAMNQSVVDRSNMVLDIQEPSMEVMIDRAMAMSGNTDKAMVTEMAKVIDAIDKEMLATGIEDGVCGMRSLANWATCARFQNPYDCFDNCALAKTSFDEEARESLRKIINESPLRPSRRRKGR